MKTLTLTFICPTLLALLLLCGLAAAEVRPELRDLRFSTVAPGTEKVVLHLNGSYSPKVFTMKGETPRLVLDFAGMTHSTRVSPLTVVNGALVQRIRVGLHPGEAPKTRVVLDLATLAEVSFDQRFDPAASTLTIELTVQGKGAPPAVIGRTASGPVQKTPATARTVPATRLAKPPLAATAGQADTPSTPAADTGKQDGTGAISGAIGAVDGAPAAQQKEAAAEPVAADTAKQDKPPQPPAAPETPAGTKAAATPAPAIGQPAVAATAADKAAPPVAAQGAATIPGEQPDRTAATQASQVTADNKTAQTAAPQTQAATETTAPAPAAPAGPMLESVTFDGKSPKGEMVLFKLNTFHPPEVHGVEQGIPRVICDFKDTRLADAAQNLIKTDGQHVKVIRISKTVQPEKVRVVLDLEPNRSYDLQQVFFKEDNLFVIIVNTVQN